MAPPRACDCHMHIYDAARFPMPPMERRAPTNAAVAQYRLQTRLRTTRVIVVTPRHYATDNRATIDAVAQMAPLGWHVQINMTADQIADAETLWNRLAAPIVFDHIGQIPGAGGTAHRAYAVVRRLLDRRQAWVKLSVTYNNTIDGPPRYTDAVTVGQALVKAAPERLVWGSNWPHPNETRKPDDARLFDLMMQWAPDEAARRRILVDNPARLYGFAGVPS
jgi:predicted TIM-barrel fold metal-dependent hydrolase